LGCQDHTLAALTLEMTRYPSWTGKTLPFLHLSFESSERLGCQGHALAALTLEMTRYPSWTGKTLPFLYLSFASSETANRQTFLLTSERISVCLFQTLHSSSSSAVLSSSQRGPYDPPWGPQQLLSRPPKRRYTNEIFQI